MFPVEQKRDIANAVQKILRDTGHPELPITEIKFMLHVHGRFQWSWANIKNNRAISNPLVNPWNEAQATPPDPQHGRDVKPEHGTLACELPAPKPLAQYLMEYIEHEIENRNIDITTNKGVIMLSADYNSWRELLEQALDAYESTENVTIKIERI